MFLQKHLVKNFFSEKIWKVVFRNLTFFKFLTRRAEIWLEEEANVVYFDQLLGAALPQKLVKNIFWPFSDIISQYYKKSPILTIYPSR